METATLTSKSQITVPKAVREALGLQAGDKIRFVPSLGGYRLVAVKADITDLRGFLKSPRRRPVSIADMNRAIEEGAVQRYQRATRPAKR
jgi:AbrB family looped-hinge helix DNA binding protein